MLAICGLPFRAEALMCTIDQQYERKFLDILGQFWRSTILAESCVLAVYYEKPITVVKGIELENGINAVAT